MTDDDDPDAGGSTEDPDVIGSTAEFERAFGDALAAVPREHVDESRFVPGVGPLDAPVALVGEAPGADEVDAGAPFVGRAGRRLDEALAALDVDREALYVTNLVKVRPPENRTPRTGEIAAWRPVLDAELDRVSPDVVVPLGSTATEAILDADGSITALQGERFERDGRTVVPAFHPAATLYDPSKDDDFERALRTAFDAV